MGETISFEVSGMTCQNCVRHVGTALRKIPGVRDVEVNLDQGTARVMLAEGKAGEATAGAMLAAIQDAGYEAKVL
ncbi:heavy-metal-associated domain-containing protein [Chondromyces apiculatus]|uniref:HMA domain-containing protein n=1 Tax=Chondromyces apiculatus DSM 436 TaxID=1192034 RepID=A0A017TFN9_9BACT|nr:heavy metal-associated domain-containing protein [Chondromyces apiculatus]EYF07635.1 Hypothetical protein CAP_8136 [Chondromyces apiculatus DSM 436]